MDIQYVDAKSNDCKGSKCGSKEKDKAINKKKNSVVNKLNTKKSIQAKGGEAADSKTNEKQQNLIRTLNCMLRAKCNVRSFIRLSNLSYQKMKVCSISGKVKYLAFEDSILSALRSKCNGHGDTNAEVRNIWRLESYESIGENVMI
ncbi:1509_t:CDS:2 [Gigaspora margarita]|uniref:1509_t:CDS:1 n=1 Tax=Gigaspora margarita TaxID=4874 RepID=A0ABN7W7Z3_GIGMA|nr:1509_t:CDS:2 [Gigaspora margarita]